VTALAGHHLLDDGHPKRTRSRAATVLLAAAIMLGIAVLTALGIWQLQRRVWKLDLIATVEQRIHAAAVPAPGPAYWPHVDATHDVYRRVSVSGMFRNDRETLVQASTELGGGYWVMTPFKADDGFVVLINRGFVPPDLKDPAKRASGQISGETSVTGLMRMTEPKGGFLRSNDPASDRWYSRDVAEISAKRGLADTAPYFIDAEGSAPGGPVGGLTVVSFPNNHLVYALTWFGLAALLAVWAVVLIREERQQRAPS
jgi:surfeit locus 1 family protein